MSRLSPAYLFIYPWSLRQVETVGGAPHPLEFALDAAITRLFQGMGISSRIWCPSILENCGGCRMPTNPFSDFLAKAVVGVLWLRKLSSVVLDGVEGGVDAINKYCL